MTTIIALGCGVIGAWIVTRLVSCSNHDSRRVAVGYYVSHGYRTKVTRQCRSEYSANMAMRQGLVK